MVNLSKGDDLKITYASKKVERYCTDYYRMKRKLLYDWVRTVKKQMDRLEAAENFGDFLAVGLGKPEQLKGYETVRYTIHVTPSLRLIIELNTAQDTVRFCSQLEVKGVSDCHGGKENWNIP